MTDLFSQWDVDHVFTTCRQRAEPYGLRFGELPWLSNSRLSLEAGEFARDMGRYTVFHHQIFKAYFSDGRDIGHMSVLMDVAGKSGLDARKLETLLDDGYYSIRVGHGSDDARRLGVTAVPCFFIEDLPPIPGAVHEDRFREVLNKVVKKG